MEHFAVDAKGNVLDQSKHDKACAGMAGAVDEAGNVVNEDKFKAASDAIAEEGKAKAKERADAKKAKGAAKQVETGSKICVRNLHEDVNTEKLTAMFAAFGKVGRVDVKTKEDGKCKGFGFVAFATKDEADKAMKEMNGKVVDDKKLAVTLAFESVEGGKGGEKGKDGKGKGKGKDDGKGAKGKGKGKKGDAMTVGGYPQADQYQAYQAQVQQWYAMQMQAAMMAQYQAQQVQGWYQSMGTDASGVPQAGGAAPAAAAGGKEYEGSLKRITQSKSAREAYGFIECPELKGQWKDTKNLEGRDIYIAAALIPENCTEPGSKVKFTLGLNAKGHPQAVSCVAI